MRIILIHNNYGLNAIGGEKMVFDNEHEILKENGHDVITFEVSNFENTNILRTIINLIFSTWNPFYYLEIRKLIKKFNPDVIHVHNYWFKLSPSIFYAAKKKRVKTVVTLHNYRMLCPGVLFLRNGKPCIDCTKKNALRSLYYRCHSNNFFKTLLSYRLFSFTKRKNYFNKYIDAYICLTDFQKNFFQGKIPEKQLFTKANFISNTSISKKVIKEKKFALYVGRISEEKGITFLANCWKEINYKLVIVGTGDKKLIETLKENPNISLKGALTNSEALTYIEKSDFLVFPSICFEGFPMTILEAMSLGKPIIASNLGARNEAIIDYETGILYDHNNTNDFITKVNELYKDLNLKKTLGYNAKKHFDKHFKKEINYQKLMSIYNQILNETEFHKA